MSSEVTPQSVQHIFELYSENKLYVNRRYQRKLVWTVEEKEKFIDSLANGYPIPMVLTSKQEGKQHGDTDFLEVLDGLQRLNAITSFIECDFSLNGAYFDLDSTSITKSLKNSGDINQKTPVLDQKICSAILNYQIPFLKTQINTPDFIDETFRRINTGGRRLSKQDVRQAGAIGVVFETINNVSNYVRKDSSKTNLVSLKNMKDISIGNKSLNYGIDINEVFWVRNGIINKEGIRESRDEELIAHLLSYVLVGENSHTTAYYLNKVYDFDSREYSDLASEIEKYENDFIAKSLNYVFDEIEKTFSTDRQTFSKVIFKNEVKKTSPCFQVVFLSFYYFLIKENKSINNYKNLHSSLSNIYDSLYIGTLGKSEKWNNAQRTRLIEATKGVIADNFSNNGNNEFKPGKWVRNLENIINESKTEQQSYDFKASLAVFETGEINFKLIDKILKTLTAMTNSVLGECTIIVGVAETEEAAKKHKESYCDDYIEYGGKYIVGIDSESIGFSSLGGVDAYLKTIKEYVSRNTLVSSHFRKKVLNKMVSFTYKNKEVLIFIAERGDDPEQYDGSYYERHLSHNNQVNSGEEMNSLFRRFISK